MPRRPEATPARDTVEAKALAGDERSDATDGADEAEESATKVAAAATSPRAAG